MDLNGERQGGNNIFKVQKKENKDKKSSGYSHYYFIKKYLKIAFFKIQFF